MPTKKITVTSTSTIRDGETNGKTWCLSEVKANDADGNEILEQLKTFMTLVAGETYEVEVERQDHEKYGTSFMLSLPGSGGAGARRSSGGGGSSEIADKIKGLVYRVEQLERKITSLEQATPGGAPAAQGAGYVGEEDIPFLWDGPVLELDLVKAHLARP